MKTLEKFSNLKISDEEQEMVNGGYKTSGSGVAPNGSKYSYDGDLTGTADGSIGVSNGVISASGNIYVKDFTGKISVDGVTRTNFWEDVP